MCGRDLGPLGGPSKADDLIDRVAGRRRFDLDSTQCAAAAPQVDYASIRSEVTEEARFPPSSCRGYSRFSVSSFPLLELLHLLPVF